MAAKAPARHKPAGQLPVPGGTGTTGGFNAGAVSTAASGSGSDPFTAFANTPLNQLTPTATPAAWGISDTSTRLFTGSKSQDVPITSPLRFNRLLGDLSDRIGIRSEVVGKSAQQSVAESLARYVGLQGAEGPADAIMREVGDKLGVPKKIAGQSLYAAVAEKLGVDVTGSSKIVNDPQYMNILQVASSIYNLNPQQLEALQTQLFDAGYYDQRVYTDATDAAKITPGQLDPGTMMAFGKMLSTVAKYQPNQKWSDVLGQQATAGAKSAGTAGDSLEQILGTSKVPTVTQATTAQLFDPLRQAYLSLLGRLPTDAELQQFAQQYDQAQIANSSKITPGQIIFPDSDTGVQLEPGVPRPTYAAEAMAMSDSTEYNAHNLANAAGLMTNAIRGGGLGADANQTSSG